MGKPGKSRALTREFAENCECTCEPRPRLKDRYVTETAANYQGWTAGPARTASNKPPQKNKSTLFDNREDIPGAFVTEAQDEFCWVDQHASNMPPPPPVQTEPELFGAGCKAGACDCCKARALHGLPLSSSCYHDTKLSQAHKVSPSTPACHCQSPRPAGSQAQQCAPSALRTPTQRALAPSQATGLQNCTNATKPNVRDLNLERVKQDGYVGLGNQKKTRALLKNSRDPVNASWPPAAGAKKASTAPRKKGNSQKETTASRSRRLTPRDPNFFKKLDERRAAAVRLSRAEVQNFNELEKPDFHNYGRAATSPVRGGVGYGDHMKTHNVQPQVPPNRPKSKQLYEELELKALKNPEKIKFRGRSICYAPRDTQFDPYEDPESLKLAEKIRGIGLTPLDQDQYSSAASEQSEEEILGTHKQLPTRPAVPAAEHRGDGDCAMAMSHPCRPDEAEEDDTSQKYADLSEEQYLKLGNNPRSYKYLPRGVGWTNLITPAGRRTRDGDHVVDCIYLYD